jgi:hypothetical protein
VTGKRPSDDADEPSEEELERHQVEPLPDREAMSFVGDVSIPPDPDAAANALLDQAPEDPAEP